jgi:hypothetical protein
MAVNGEPCRRRRHHGEVGCLTSLAVSSSGEGLLEDEGVEADLFLGLDDNKEGWWWPTTVSTTSSGGAKQSARKRNGKGEALPGHARGDKAAEIRWAAVSRSSRGLKVGGLGEVGMTLTSRPHPV